MLNNIFEIESSLMQVLNLHLATDMSISEEDAHKIKKDMFKTLPDADRIAGTIQYAGFDIPETQANTRNQLIEVNYRVIIVAPIENKHRAGEVFVDVLRDLSGLKLAGKKPVSLIKDVREFNAADYGNGLIAIPALFSYKTTIRST